MFNEVGANRIEKDNKIQLMTAREVVDQLFDGKISYRRLLQLTREGQLNALRLGHSYYYSSDEIRSWLEKNLKTPAWTKAKA